MEKIDKKTILLAVGLVVALMSTYIVYGIQIMPMLILFIPIPFLALGIRIGLLYNILTIVLTLFSVILIGDARSFFIIVAFAPLIIGMNYAIEKKKDSKEAILISSLSFLIPFLIFLILWIKIADVDFLSKLDTIFTGYITKQKELLNEFGVTNNRIVQLIEDAESGFVIVKMLIPYLLSFFTVFIASINYLLIGIILRGIGFKLIERPIFSKFKLPDNIILGSGIMILTGLIASWLKLEYSQALVLNIIFIVETIFIVQGFAVFDFFLKKRNIRLAFRVLLSIMLLPLAGIMIIIGFLDSAFDIRKLRRLKS